MPSRISFEAFLLSAFDQGDYSTDDVIAFVLPLFRKVLGFHEAGLVAPFEYPDAAFLNEMEFELDEALAHPPSAALYRIDAEKGTYVRGYRCYEFDFDHHDPLTDIFCLGLVAGSMALGLNLYEDENLQEFARVRVNPSGHRPRIHPTLGRLVTEMTELDRNRRSQDLYDIIRRLEHYRDYTPEKQLDPSQIAGWLQKELKERDAFILNKLRSRLFDTSRRNRLLYFKPNTRFVNLTVGSIPIVLHHRSIRPELLFTWNAEVAEKITAMNEIVLNKYLRFEDHPYLLPSLDRVRLESQRDINEYGFSQLKLVIAFLSWYNSKEEPDERIQTPLLLLPVSLKRNKKVKADHYVLKVLDNVAEVNPVLAGQLSALYGIRLPDFIDLEEMSPRQFYQHVQTQVEEANQAIRLDFVDQPRIPLVQQEARQTVSNFRRRRRMGAESPGTTELPESGEPLETTDIPESRGPLETTELPESREPLETSESPKSREPLETSDPPET
ncbi:MAG TPA: DUF4011 domain-containing protein, partial [Puia sp.]|nr:DUF4011 domain-containing protein [Puia sp.]